MLPKSKILIVDDVEDNISVLGSLLMNKGFVVQIAQNGEQALKAVEKKLPDLILLDIAMPGMSGFDVCKRLKEKESTQDIPIIFLTAYNDTQSIIEGLKLGAVDYVTKPFNIHELISRVNTHLELKHSKTKLLEKNEQLKELNATKDKLFSIISHDLRNPFHAIIGFSDLVLDKLEKEDYENVKLFSKQINTSARLTYNLLCNLLYWSNHQRGKLKYFPEELNIIQIVESVLDILRLNYQEKNISVSILIEPNIKVIADKFMLETILRNLISNAIKYTPELGEIKIVAYQLENFVNVSVEDNGVGMNKNQLNTLFNIESNTSTPGTNKEKGTGLGLVICKEFVEKHDGQISVESETDKGSKFSFTLKSAS